MTNTPSTQPAKQDPMHPTLDAGNVRGVGRAQEEREARWAEEMLRLVRQGCLPTEAGMALADEERAAVVAELEQARAEVERLIEAHQKQRRFADQNFERWQTAEAREVALRERIEALLESPTLQSCGGLDIGDDGCFLGDLVRPLRAALAAEPTPPAAPHADDGAKEPHYTCGHSYREPGCGWPCCGYPDHPAPMADPSGTGETR